MIHENLMRRFKKTGRQTEAILSMWIKRHNEEQSIIVTQETINDTKRKQRQTIKLIIVYRVETRVRQRYKTTNEKIP